MALLSNGRKQKGKDDSDDRNQYGVGDSDNCQQANDHATASVPGQLWH